MPYAYGEALAANIESLLEALVSAALARVNAA
jgi:hypothetical protein